MRKQSVSPSRFRGGFSISEVIVSMALIIMLSVAGFAACYIGLSMQQSADRSVEIWSISDAISDAFGLALDDSGGVSDDESKKADFVLAFNKRIAFAVDCWAPDVKSFTGSYALDGGEWTVDVVTEGKTDYVAVPDGNGGFVTEERIVASSGLSLTYSGVHNGSASFIFVYRYFTPNIEVIATVNVRTGNYYLDVEGYSSGKEKATYTLREVYS